MNKNDRSELGNQMIEGMRQFLDDLENERPIRVTEVTREETPDGPLHSRVKRIMRYRKNEES